MTASQFTAIHAEKNVLIQKTKYLIHAFQGFAASPLALLSDVIQQLTAEK